MAKWTLTIEGEAGELQDVLGTLQKLLSQAGSTTLDVEDKSGSSSQWSYEEFSRLWRGLTRGARTALREMANRPNGYRTSELEKALGKSIQSIGPELSSVGHQMRSFPDKPHPYKRDATTGWSYVLVSEEVAEFIRTLADTAE